jgi:hypothetical protein
MTVRAEGDHLSKSFFVNQTIYKTFTTYFNSMLSHEADCPTYPQFTPAQQNILLAMNSLLKDVIKSSAISDKSMNVSKSVNDSLVTYFKEMVNSQAAVKNESEIFPQFTPAEQTKIMLFLTLVEQNLK